MSQEVSTWVVNGYWGHNPLILTFYKLPGTSKQLPPKIFRHMWKIHTISASFILIGISIPAKSLKFKHSAGNVIALVIMVTLCTFEPPIKNTLTFHCTGCLIGILI